MGALTLVGAVLSAANAVAASAAEADAADFNVEISQRQAERERAIAAREAADSRRRGSRFLAASRARRAGSGVTFQGSPLLVEEAQAAEIELEAQDHLFAGASEAEALERRAALGRARAGAARAAGFRRAGSTLLTASRRGGFFDI